MVEVIERVPFFANMSPRDVEGIPRCSRNAASLRARLYQGGRGRCGVLRDRVGRGDRLHRREARATLSSGDYFGEVALIDEGARSATITADTELVCYGLTYREFRPLVQHNATIAWNLLQTLAKRLRTAQGDLPE